MIFLLLALYLKYKKNMSLRLQILRMKVRVKKSIKDLQNKDKVNSILERVRQKKAQKIGADITKEQLVPKASITQNFKAALKAKVQKNRIVQKLQGFYTKYKDKYLKKNAQDGIAETKIAQEIKKNIPLSAKKLNINPALLKKASIAARTASENVPTTAAPNKALKNKLANMMRKQKSQIKELNKQTYCHDENKHPQSQNSQMP